MTIGWFIAIVFFAAWIGCIVLIAWLQHRAPLRPDLDDTVFVSSRLRERRHTHPRRAHRSGVGSPWR